MGNLADCFLHTPLQSDTKGYKNTSIHKGTANPIVYSSRQHHSHSSSRFSSFLPLLHRTTATQLEMAAKYIIASVMGSFGIAYVTDELVSSKKIFGGTTPRTISNKEWWEETDKKFQAWPRTASPPVVMNPISRHNFIVKSDS
ncbi:hypothetical protein DITRI_Ditri06bG0016100 [Diplodiscus trichospermus]